MKPLPRYPKCFICGRENHCGLSITFQTDGERVFAEFKPAEHHVGYKDHIHGGILSAVLDEIMGWAICVKTGLLFNTWELSVRYLLPLQPGMEVRAVAEMVDDKHRYLTAEGYIEDSEGNIYAKGWGKYFPLKDEATDEILSYLENEDGGQPSMEDLRAG